MQMNWEGPPCHPLPWICTLAYSLWLSSYLHPHQYTAPQHQRAHPSCTWNKKWTRTEKKGTATLRFTPRCPLPWPCRPPVPDTSSQVLVEDTCASACHTFPCNWSCHCIISEHHHPVNKKKGARERRGRRRKKNKIDIEEGWTGIRKRQEDKSNINRWSGVFFFFCVSSQKSVTSRRGETLLYPSV